MEYQKGQYVVYNGLEICRIGDLVKMCFDGINEKEYYTLSPADIKSSVYYIPSDKIEENIRPVLSKEQLLELIDRLPNTESEWIADKNERKYDFSSAIKSGDYNRIIPLMNGIYNEKNQREKNGKKLLNSDKRNFDTAVKLLHSEIAFSFGIEIDEAETFIRNRIKNIDIKDFHQL